MKRPDEFQCLKCGYVWQSWNYAKKKPPCPKCKSLVYKWTNWRDTEIKLKLQKGEYK